MLVTEIQQQQVAQRITEIERRTDAELVCVLAARSDAYYEIPTLWAALIALASPILLFATNWWVHTHWILGVQLTVFLSLTFLLRWPPLLMRCVPKSVRYWRASNLARRQFLDNNLHNTEGETGLLIFISEAEGYVEIIADRGIARQVPNATWQTIIDQFIARIKQHQTLPGLLDCLDQCGHLLAQHVPATQQKNELSNRLIILK